VGAPHKSLAADSSLNDDSAEKRQRREERVANKHLEHKKVVAAAATTTTTTSTAHGSPLRNPNHVIPTSPPCTPNGTLLRTVAEPPNSPVRKVPILANFEEWMKMATDNVRSHARRSELMVENQCDE
jgi:hypothetical protein